MPWKESSFTKVFHIYWQFYNNQFLLKNGKTTEQMNMASLFTLQKPFAKK